MFEGIINNILNEQFQITILLESQDVIIGFIHESKNIRIFINFILHILKWELWKIRNKIKFEHQRFSANQITGIIVSKIKDATNFIEKN